MKLRNEVVLRVEFDDCGILFDYRTGNNFFLNPTGVIICSYLEKTDGASRETILEAIATNTQGATRNAGADVDAFLESLEKKDLIIP